jgi:phosphatidylserine decarboxylase
VSYYVVQIGGGGVHGIDVYPDVGQPVEQGEIFGMIRIGSQVDLIVPDLPGLEIQVRPGDRVVAGESVLLA